MFYSTLFPHGMSEPQAGRICKDRSIEHGILASEANYVVLNGTRNTSLEVSVE